MKFPKILFGSNMIVQEGFVTLITVADRLVVSSNQSASSQRQFNSKKLSTKINQMDLSKISIRWTITSSLIRRNCQKINYQSSGNCRPTISSDQKNFKILSFIFFDIFLGIVVDKSKRAKIEDGSWTENDLFQPFLICFADLKKYHYYYWD